MIKNIYELTNFMCNDKEYILSQSIPLTISEDEFNNFWAINKDFDITGWGITEDDAIVDTRNELGTTYSLKFGNMRSINVSKLIEKIDSLIVGDPHD